MSNKEKILHAAMIEFTTKGYTQTSVNKLIAITGLSKGTFYHYFKSKEEVLDTIIDIALSQLLSHVKATIQKHADANPIELLTHVLIALNTQHEQTSVDEMIHAPENVLLHQKLNAQMIQRLTPIICEIIERGVSQQVFSVQFSNVIIEILLLSQYLFDKTMFQWTDIELREKIIGTVFALERLLGVEEGSFYAYQNYLLQTMIKGAQDE